MSRFRETLAYFKEKLLPEKIYTGYSDPSDGVLETLQREINYLNRMNARLLLLLVKRELITPEAAAEVWTGDKEQDEPYLDEYDVPALFIPNRINRPPQKKVGTCSVCVEAQYMTASGITCDNGHGGAESLENLTPVNFRFYILLNGNEMNTIGVVKAKTAKFAFDTLRIVYQRKIGIFSEETDLVTGVPLKYDGHDLKFDRHPLGSPIEGE